MIMANRDVAGVALFAVVAFVFAGGAVQTAGPSFRPDVSVKGSALTGWHTLGAASWRADNGEIVGTPNTGGGWLVLDRSLQDVAFYASFLCASGCETGVLLRAEKTPQGMKGVYVSLSGTGVANYSVTLDAHGKILSREALRAGNQDVR